MATRHPFPVEFDALRRSSDEEVFTLARDGANPDVMLKGFAGWLREGRVCYRLEPDLLHALLLTDVPDDLSLSPPHDAFWVDLEGLTSMQVEGELIVGFWVTIFDTTTEDDNWVIVATSRTLDNGMHAHFWVPVAPDSVLDKNLSQAEEEIAANLRRIALLVTFYLMDPAHEEASEPIHGNREWRASMKLRGAKDPDRHLPFVKHRVLGKTYRLPDDANLSDGTKLGLRVAVRGHIRKQRIGPGRRDVRATWVRPHFRGPESAMSSAVATHVPNPSAPDIAHTERCARVREAMTQRK